MNFSFKQYLAEKASTGYFVFGRLNPPTTGHGKLLDALSKAAGGKNYHVFVSQSSDPKKNPLGYEQKVKFIRKMFPKHARNVMMDKDVKNFLDAAVWMHNQGYKNCVMVAGSDRVGEFEKLLTKYNGVESKHGLFDFETVKVVSAGERDPDKDDVSGMSASKQRKNAADNDFAAFSQGVPKGASDSLAKELFNAVRKGMGLNEARSFSAHVELDRSSIREAFHNGDIFNVGDEVEHKGVTRIISKRGANHVVLEGVGSVWLDDITEKVSKSQIDQLEKFADKLLAKYDIDIEFTRHFAERINDDRNDPDIKVAELQKFFKKIHKAKGNKIKSVGDLQAVLKDINAELNFPAVIEKDGKEGWKVYMKTVMRKKDFKTPSKVIAYEGTEVPQDDDIEDRKGSQPKKYFKDLKKSTKKSRDAHFKKNAKKSDDDSSAYEPAPGDKDAETKPSKHTKKFKQMFGEDAKKGLAAKAEKSGISVSILRKVYNRGMAAWKTGHRPGTTPQQWGMARVNSFITGGKTRTTADKDLWSQHKGK